MQLAWESNTGTASNRKRASKACSHCQQRKKRCFHVQEEDVKTYAVPGNSRAKRRCLSANARIETETSQAEVEVVELIQDEHCDKIPACILADLSMSLSPKSTSSTPHNTTRSDQDQQTKTSTLGLSLAFRVSRAEYAVFSKHQQRLSEARRKYLEDAGAFLTLPKATVGGLLAAYLTSLDGVIPIVDGLQVLLDYSQEKCSPYLLRAMCMVASKTELAKPHLRLEEGGPLLSPLIFARTLYKSLEISMKEELETNMVTKIQIWSLMHLHNDGPRGAKEASALLSQAIHEAWAIKLHFRGPERTPDDRLSLLWWCLRNFDKINSCVYGGPRMINEQDIDLPHPTVGPDHHLHSITLFTRIGDLLAKVLEIYRAVYHGNLKGIETELPDFSEIVEGIDIERMQRSHLEFFELCYHTAAMLSCRDSSPGTTSYRRRLRAADRVQELTMGGRWSHFPPLPILPYAVSLSLTVAFRAMLDFQKEITLVYQEISIRLEILKGLSAHWWTAKAMAAFATKVQDGIKFTSPQQQSLRSLNYDQNKTNANELLDLGQEISQQATTGINYEHGSATAWTIETDISSSLNDLFDDVYAADLPLLTPEMSLWNPEHLQSGIRQ